MAAILRIYEENGNLLTSITTDNKTKVYGSGDTKAVLDRINLDQITNFDYHGKNISFMYQEVLFELVNYPKLRSHDATVIFDKKLTDFINNYMSSIKKTNNTRKTNRNASRLVAGVLAGVTIFIVAKTFVNKNEKPNDINSYNPGSITITEIKNEEEKEIASDEIKIEEPKKESIIQQPIKEDEPVQITIDNSNNYEEYIEEQTKEIAANPERVTSFVTLSYDDKTAETDYVRSEWGKIITTYANMYGIDPELMIAIATQESGGIATSTNGYGTGIMGLEIEPWLAEGSITAHNFQTNKNDTVYINSIEDLNNPETNIQIRCMHVRNLLEKYNGNILLALHGGMGHGNMSQILNETASYYNMSVNDIINNASFTGWMDFTNMNGVSGDPNYILNVLGRTEQTSFVCQMENGFEVGLDVTNERITTKTM